jgi:hypothetical protein
VIAFGSLVASEFLTERHFHDEHPAELVSID